MSDTVGRPPRSLTGQKHTIPRPPKRTRCDPYAGRYSVSVLDLDNDCSFQVGIFLISRLDRTRTFTLIPMPSRLAAILYQG